jgi:hypothetical protein
MPLPTPKPKLERLRLAPGGAPPIVADTKSYEKDEEMMQLQCFFAYSQIDVTENWSHPFQKPVMFTAQNRSQVGYALPVASLWRRQLQIACGIFPDCLLDFPLRRYGKGFSHAASHIMDVDILITFNRRNDLQFLTGFCYRCMIEVIRKQKKSDHQPMSCKQTGDRSSSHSRRNGVI